MTEQTPEYQTQREKIERMIKFYCEKTGFKPNQDPKIYDMVVDGLTKNKLKYGFAYCPCRLVTGEKEDDKKIICPCVYHKDEIAKDGHCHCLLYYR